MWCVVPHEIIHKILGFVAYFAAVCLPNWVFYFRAPRPVYRLRFVLNLIETKVAKIHFILFRKQNESCRSRPTTQAPISRDREVVLLFGLSQYECFVYSLDLSVFYKHRLSAFQDILLEYLKMPKRTGGEQLPLQNDCRFSFLGGGRRENSSES